MGLVCQVTAGRRVSKECRKLIGGTSGIQIVAVPTLSCIQSLATISCSNKFGMPNACACLTARHSCQDGKPNPNTPKLRRKQNEHCKETHRADGVAVSPVCNSDNGADFQ